jgi:hypothetical protein
MRSGAEENGVRAEGASWSEVVVSGLLKSAGYNPYPCTRGPYPCSGIGGYTGTGLRRAGQFFLEKSRCTLPVYLAYLPPVPVPAYPRPCTRVSVYPLEKMIHVSQPFWINPNPISNCKLYKASTGHWIHWFFISTKFKIICKVIDFLNFYFYFTF